MTNLIAAYENIQRYLSNPAPAALPNSEIEALEFLKNKPDSLVLTYPYNKYVKDNFQTPISLYAYETTSYVSAFSHQTVFLEDEMNLSITGFDWQSRKNSSLEFFTTDNEYLARGFLVNNQIDYIYLVGDQKINLSESQLQINQVFNNGQVKIYQVQR